MPTWIPGKVIKIKHWTNHLFTITLHASVNMFTAGQFTKIGIKINEKIIQRAYSYLNSPKQPNLKFYITTVQFGKLTTILHKLTPGDEILISKESYGQFTLNNIPNCTNLWMIASGTGISPYLSILESLDTRLNQFLKIILIHAVRHTKNLNYLHKITQLQKLYRNKLIIQTILSREKSSNSLYGRIPDLIKNNILEQQIGLSLNKNSHIMLCGNPNMISDTKTILHKKYGLKNHSRKNIGQITQERYW